MHRHLRSRAFMSPWSIPPIHRRLISLRCDTVSRSTQPIWRQITHTQVSSASTTLDVTTRGPHTVRGKIFNDHGGSTTYTSDSIPVIDNDPVIVFDEAFSLRINANFYTFDFVT